MKQIIVTEPGSVSPSEKKKLKGEDIVIIEVIEPERVRIIRATDGFELDAIGKIALSALAESTNGESIFGRKLVAHFNAQNKKAQEK